MLQMNTMGTHAKVLVVEDEEPLALLLRYNLEAEGYAVDVVHRGERPHQGAHHRRRRLRGEAILIA